MIFIDFQWSYWVSLIFIDFQWFVMIFNDFHSFSMILIDFQWFSKMFKDFQWFSLIFNDFHRSVSILWLGWLGWPDCSGSHLRFPENPGLIFQYRFYYKFLNENCFLANLRGVPLWEAPASSCLASGCRPGQVAPAAISQTWTETYLRDGFPIEPHQHFGNSNILRPQRKNF